MGLKVSPGALHPRRIVMRSTGAGRRIVIRPSASGGSGGGVTDHGALTGLGDDDHGQYALADGTRGDFATTAQGDLADTAVQPSALGDAITAHTATTDPHGDRAYTDAQIIASLANFVAGAPGILDTWLEMVTAIQADQTGLAALTTVVAGKLAKASNLSDLADVPTARGNLGLGSAATTASTDYDPAGAASTAQAAAIAAAATDATTKADAKVADTINDGTTTVAPSQNAVYDALTGKETAGAAAAAQAAAVQRANHTGTQSADTLTDGTTNKAFLATERTKLAGIATGATANDTDANLKARANHTGTQLASTISDFETAVVRQPVSTFVSAQYVAQLIVPTTTPQTSNRMYMYPFFVHKTTTFDRIAINHAATTAGAGSVCRLGIYNDSSGVPGTLLLDAGTVALDTAAALKPITISQQLTPGLYWLAAVAQITSGTPTFTCGSPGIGVPSSDNVFNGCKFQNSVTSTLPSTATPGAANATNPTAVFLRAT